MSAVIRLGKLRGWIVAHFRPGRTAKGWATPVQADGKGFPDLFMLRPARRKGDCSRVIGAELKVGKNQPTPEQRRWLDAMRAVGIEVRLWRPEDWPEIEKTLE